jgi:hypothetical protein
VLGIRKKNLEISNKVLDYQTHLNTNIAVEESLPMNYINSKQRVVPSKRIASIPNEDLQSLIEMEKRLVQIISICDPRSN